MVHGYHVTLRMHGFWLPNDPRGSWSQFVGSWELLRFGETTRDLHQRRLDQLSPYELALRNEARMALKYRAVSLTGLQARAIGRGFARHVRKSGHTVWACSILAENAHVVIARHRYKVEQMANLLKGAATKQLIVEDIHPLSDVACDSNVPTVWAAGEWKSFLDSAQAIENAIGYVIENPLKEEKPRQKWNFVSPFRGVDSAGVNTDAFNREPQASARMPWVTWVWDVPDARRWLAVKRPVPSGRAARTTPFAWAEPMRAMIEGERKPLIRCRNPSAVSTVA